jgi:hypothetical protein
MAVGKCGHFETRKYAKAAKMAKEIAKKSAAAG